MTVVYFPILSTLSYTICVLASIINELSTIFGSL